MDLEDWDVLQPDEPSAEEKALLDTAFEACTRQPDAGRLWRDVLAEIRGSNSPTPFFPMGSNSADL